MSFNLFLSIIILIPVIAAMAVSQIAQNLIDLAILITFISILAFSSASEMAHAVRVTRGLKIIAIFNVIWLIFQIAPLPSWGLSNALWSSAATALNTSLWAHISIDIGNTINAIVQYLIALILIVTAIFVASDRRQAELVLYSLTAIATFVVLELELVVTGFIPTWGGEAVDHSRQMLAGIATLGAILNLATSSLLIKRLKNSSIQEFSRRHQFLFLILYLAGFTFCMFIVAKTMATNILIVALFGTATFVVVELIRRFNLTLSLALSLCLSFFLMAFLIICWRYNSTVPLSFPLQFSDAPAATLEIVERMLSETKWTGSGAGSFSALWQIYRTLDGAALASAPTTAASVLITSGIPVFVASLLASIFLLVIFFRGALRRRRDSVYAAAAAAAVVILFCQSFCDASLESTIAALIGEIMIGLGLSQSVSQELR
jgi:hypothetical protein